MTYEELIERKGKFVFVYLDNLDTWVRCKVKTMGTVYVDEKDELQVGPDMIMLEGLIKKIDMRMRLDLQDQKQVTKWQIKVKL